MKEMERETEGWKDSEKSERTGRGTNKKEKEKKLENK